MAGTTRLELATSAVTEEPRRPRGLPNTAQVAQGLAICGLGCGLEKSHRLFPSPCSSGSHLRLEPAVLTDPTSFTVEIACAIDHWFLPAMTPPSTFKTVPVIHDAWSEGRKSIAAATSSGLPMRPKEWKPLKPANVSDTFSASMKAS